MKKLADEFINQMVNLLGKEEAQRLMEALQKESPTSIRLNPFKPVEPSTNPIYINKVYGCEEGRFLSQRPAFTFDPLFHAGCYYVQEASSMILCQAIRQCISEPVFALDLCGAPGGKSTLLRASLPKGSALVSNEIIRGRAQILAENMVKWGHPEVMVTNNAPADFAPCENLFDVIVADVPCSGEGMFRKDDEAIDNWSLENVSMCANRQRSIIADVWSALKPGGLLIYSTCTFNVEENEHNVAWIAQEYGAEVLPLALPEGCDAVGNLLGEDYPVWHFFQHRVEGEGFFIAILRKPEEIGFRSLYLPDINSSAQGKKKCKQKTALPVKEILQVTQTWVKDPEQYYWQVTEEGVRALPLSMASFYLWGQKHGLKFLEAGILVATLKGKEPIPAHQLAMSCALQSIGFPIVNLCFRDAISYLRKETIFLPPDTPKGYVLLTFRTQPLGFVKNLGNRANNLYPQEWRIRSGYIPEEFEVI